MFGCFRFHDFIPKKRACIVTESPEFTGNAKPTTEGDLYLERQVIMACERAGSGTFCLKES